MITYGGCGFLRSGFSWTKPLAIATGCGVSPPGHHLSGGGRRRGWLGSPPLSICGGTLTHAGSHEPRGHRGLRFGAVGGALRTPRAGRGGRVEVLDPRAGAFSSHGWPCRPTGGKSRPRPGAFFDDSRPRRRRSRMRRPRSLKRATRRGDHLHLRSAIEAPYRGSIAL